MMRAHHGSGVHGEQYPGGGCFLPEWAYSGPLQSEALLSSGLGWGRSDALAPKQIYR